MLACPPQNQNTMPLNCSNAAATCAIIRVLQCPWLQSIYEGMRNVTFETQQPWQNLQKRPFVPDADTNLPQETQSNVPPSRCSNTHTLETSTTPAYYLNLLSRSCPLPGRSNHLQSAAQAAADAVSGRFAPPVSFAFATSRPAPPPLPLPLLLDLPALRSASSSLICGRHKQS